METEKPSLASAEFQESMKELWIFERKKGAALSAGRLLDLRRLDPRLWIGG
jgi:hypothetical protein